MSWKSGTDREDCERRRTSNATRYAVAHNFLQIVTVALGSPLGRDVAPRQLGAVLATLLCERCETFARVESNSGCMRRGLTAV